MLLLISLWLVWPAAAQEMSELFRQGQEVYAENCASCHRRNGQGLPDVFPGLKGNPLVTGDPAPIIQIILEGRQGKIGRMPAWQDSLSDQKIAGVVTYIRQNWGNQAEAVPPELVARSRRK